MSWKGWTGACWRPGIASLPPEVLLAVEKRWRSPVRTPVDANMAWNPGAVIKWMAFAVSLPSVGEHWPLREAMVSMGRAKSKAAAALKLEKHAPASFQPASQGRGPWTGVNAAHIMPRPRGRADTAGAWHKCLAWQNRWARLMQCDRIHSEYTPKKPQLEGSRPRH